MTFSYYAACKQLLLEQKLINEINSLTSNEPPTDIELNYALVASFDEQEQALLFLAINIINVPYVKFYVNIESKINIYAFERNLDKDIYLSLLESGKLFYTQDIVKTICSTINTSQLIDGLLRTVITVN